MDNQPPPDTPLRALVDALDRYGLTTPARIALDICAPLDIISSQMALFMRPFTTGTRWNRYATVLSDAQGWQELRRILARQEC